MLLVGSCVCERCLHQPGVHGVQKRHGESMESRLHPTEQVSQYAAQFSCYTACCGIIAFDLESFLQSIINVVGGYCIRS